VVPLDDQNVLSLCSLGDCIDLDNNLRNPEIEARRYHAFIVGDEWTNAAVPDTTVTPELSVTVGTDWEQPFTRECFRNHNNLPKREVRKEPLQFAFQGGRRKRELEQKRNTTRYPSLRLEMAAPAAEHW
jgi:hypothetical protein